MVTRRGTRYSRPTPAPKCAHCASTGHVATSCPRTSYNAPSLPSLKCSSCVLVARSGYSDEPLTHQIILTIDPCLAHASSTSRPSRPTSSLSRRPRLNLPGIPPTAPRLSSAPSTSSTQSVPVSPPPPAAPTASASPATPPPANMLLKYSFRWSRMFDKN